MARLAEARGLSLWPAPDFRFEAYAVRPAPHAGLVADGDEICLGNRSLEILHAPGLVAIFERATQTLFTSDAFYGGRMFFDLPGSDRRDAKQSLARFIPLIASDRVPWRGVAH